MSLADNLGVALPSTCITGDGTSDDEENCPVFFSKNVYSDQALPDLPDDDELAREIAAISGSGRHCDLGALQHQQVNSAACDDPYVLSTHEQPCGSAFQP